MKTSVERVTVRVGDELKSVVIRDENGNLKYHMFIKMMEDGVVVRDDSAWKVLLEMAKAYEKLPQSQKRITTPKPRPTEAELLRAQMIADLRLEQNELH